MRRAPSRSIPALALASILALILPGAAALAAQPGASAHLAKGRSVRLDYEAFLGGLPVATATLTAELGESGYAARSTARVSNLIGVFFDARVEAEAEGALGPDGALAPTAFETRLVAGGEPLKVRMIYENGAPAVVTAEPAFRRKSYEIDPRAQAGALDPISAVVALLLPASPSAVCGRRIPVFDGRHRFDIVLSKAAASRAADAPIHCKAIYERVGGYKPKMIRRRKNFPFDIWFSIDGNGLARAIRATGATGFGQAVIRLKS